MRMGGFQEVSGAIDHAVCVLTSGHAVRMAVDMGINKSFIQLLRTGMGKGKSPEELEEERHLVVHSRVWFCVSHVACNNADFSST